MSTGSRFSPILVPLDGSEPAASVAPYVGRLARRLDADVSLLGVVPPPPPDLPLEVTGATPTLTMQYLAGLKGQLEAVPLRVRTEAAEGQASVEIVKRAHAGECGLVALATRGRSAVGPNLLGITTDRVLRSCPVPVLIVPPAEEGAAGPPEDEVNVIVVGLDGSEAATSSIEPAHELAQALGVGMILVRAAAPVDVLGGAATYFGLVSGHARNYLQMVAADLLSDGLEVETVVGPGSPQERLLEVADENPGALLVLSTRGWSNREGWALGGVTDRVVRSARHPVLVIPPPA